MRKRPAFIPDKLWFLKLIYIIFCFLFVLIGCKEETAYKIDFIGDSIVAKWDAEEAFPSYAITNLGIGGSGIKYIESLAWKEKGKWVVSLSGTNDLLHFKENETLIKSYADRYLTALENLGAEKVYVISILPREFRNEESLHPTIIKLNGELKRGVESREHMVFVNVFDEFLDGDNIDYDLFEDNLHLTPQGYEILNQALRKKFKK